MTETCDTSLLVPALLSWHPSHRDARRSLSGIRAIPGHVLLETYSVLTRLPAPHRIAPSDAGDVLGALRVDVLTLPPKAHRSLVARLATGGVRGGSVYDALVGATARHHDLTLLTRDRRARPTYDLVGVRYSLQ